MSSLKTSISADQWVSATWDEYLEVAANPQWSQASCYYFNGQLRIEMTPQGYNHSADNASIGFAISLVTGFKKIPASGLVNCTFRKAGQLEVQPDLAFYLNENAEAIPSDTSVVDLSIYPPPDLVIEIAKTSLAEDLGTKRMIYERLEVKEYWVVDVLKSKLIAFAIANTGSWQISQSRLLSMLPYSLLERALEQSRGQERGQLYSWLIEEIQKLQ